VGADQRERNPGAVLRFFGRRRPSPKTRTGTTAPVSVQPESSVARTLVLGWNQLLETGGVVVGDEVKISIDSQVVAKPA